MLWEIKSYQDESKIVELNRDDKWSTIIEGRLRCMSPKIHDH